MRNKQHIASSAAIVTKKPPKKEVTDEEFRRKLRHIKEWRKQRLAELHAKNSR